MNTKKSFENRIRGWFPQEPTLPKRSANSQNPEQKKQPMTQQNRIFLVVFGVLWILLGVLSLLTRQYTQATLFLGFGVAYIVSFYVLQKYRTQINPRKGFAVLFVAIGVLCFVFNDEATYFFSVLAVPQQFLFSAGMAILVSIAIALFLGAAVLFLGVNNLKKYLSKTYLQPFAASAVFIFLTYLVIISGVAIPYAIPVTFIIVGILVFIGLRRRFAITRPVVAVLIACMLIFGVATSGLDTVVNVPENHYLATQQAPTVSVVNLTVNTLDGKINLHFTNNNSQILQISFVKQIGPIASEHGWEYRSQSIYQNEPASIFNYTTENQQANVTAISSRIMVDITLNPTLKYNLIFFSVFGDITLNVPPGSQSIVTSSVGSKYGSVSYK